VNQIHTALCKAHAVLKWFAFGEAVRLADQVYNICIAYPDKKDDESAQKQLLEIAQKTQNFLQSHNGPPTHDESYKELSAALLKHQIG